MTRAELIDALEAALKGSRELDGRIAYNVGYGFINVHGRSFNRTVQKYGFVQFGNSDWDSWHIPHYTTSLDAARSISNWVLVYLSDIGADGLPYVTLGNPGAKEFELCEVFGIGATIELTLCIAGIKSRG